MGHIVRIAALSAAVAALSAAAAPAQIPGQATYQQKCLSCHGPTGLADSGVGQLMKVKPISDPNVKKLSLQEMIRLTRDGEGKMQPYKGELTESEIKNSVIYFRSFAK